MTYKVIDRLFLVVFGMDGPSDADWMAYIEAVQRHGIDRTMQLIVTDGGVPNYAQRHHLNERLVGRPVPVAVVSASRRILTAVTALSWFNRRIKAFPPSAIREAMAYLWIPSSRFDLLIAELDMLGADLERAQDRQRAG